eukprot:CAMPEP_0185839414 /NCGR_PEP_ID=MMETSP1353-20130828/14544_1 /TAXON_ID=1077150 /ORGANISM="Erythrolobus australicus, Strain CCMP3124" /LENGTH=331 /DNA_ID=CAMNT_0028538571 /DNA_START=398 /DNA_END=1393 /DNA_ORIENTATION=+
MGCKCNSKSAGMRLGIGVLILFAASSFVWYARQAQCLELLPMLARRATMKADAGSDWAFRVLVTGFEPFGQLERNPALDIAVKLNRSCVRLQMQGYSVCFESKRLSVDTAGASAVAAGLEAWCAGTARGSCEAPWHAIVHLGVEAGASMLLVETVAANVCADISGPGAGHGVDAACFSDLGNGSRASNQRAQALARIHSDAPCVLPTTANLGVLGIEQIRRALGSFIILHGARRHRVSNAIDPDAAKTLTSKLSWSADLGTYFCNEVYFRTLYRVRKWSINRAPLQLGAPVLQPVQRKLLPVIFVHVPLAETVSVRDDAHIIEALALELML